MTTLSIGEIARQGGVGVETVRFYERQGLLEKPSRSESGYRQYPTEAVSRLHFIKKAKEVGFSLKEIKELLSLRLDETATCQDVRSRSEDSRRRAEASSPDKNETGADGFDKCLPRTGQRE